MCNNDWDDVDGGSSGGHGGLPLPPQCKSDLGSDACKEAVKAEIHAAVGHFTSEMGIDSILEGCFPEGQLDVVKCLELSMEHAPMPDGMVECETDAECADIELPVADRDVFGGKQQGNEEDEHDHQGQSHNFGEDGHGQAPPTQGTAENTFGKDGHGLAPSSGAFDFSRFSYKCERLLPQLPKGFCVPSFPDMPSFPLAPEYEEGFDLSGLKAAVAS